MTTTIKISNESKEKLERIRARLLLQGRKLRQDELIDFIISLAEASPIILNQEKFKGLTSKEKEKFFSFTFNGGNSTKSIDEELYS
jgi:hypothetical protein